MIQNDIKQYDAIGYWYFSFYTHLALVIEKIPKLNMHNEIWTYTFIERPRPWSMDTKYTQKVMLSWPAIKYKHCSDCLPKIWCLCRCERRGAQGNIYCIHNIDTKIYVSIIVNPPVLMRMSLELREPVMRHLTKASQLLKMFNTFLNHCSFIWFQCNEI